MPQSDKVQAFLGELFCSFVTTMKKPPHHSLKCDPKTIAKHKRRIVEIRNQIAKLEDLLSRHIAELQGREAAAQLQPGEKRPYRLTDAEHIRESKRKTPLRPFLWGFC